MYVYRVTHIPTRRFYIGVSTESRDQFDPMKFQDPMGVFDAVGSNGRVNISNVSKTIEKLAGDLNELNELAAKVAKNFEGNPAFMGLFVTPKSKGGSARSILASKAVSKPNESQ